jgi:CRISPR/Cas system-associated endonuclease Cas1
LAPFRHLVERCALTAVTRGGLGVDDFLADSGRGCRLKDEARRHWLALLTRRFDTPVKALDDAEASSIYQHLHRQNRRLIAWIRGETPAFTAWRTR